MFLRHLFYFLGFLGLDIASKQAAQFILKPLGSVEIVGTFFMFTYAENTGAAFGQFEGKTLYLAGATFFFIFLLLWGYKTSHTTGEKCGYLLVITGALGNLIDRLKLGCVIDFIDFDIPDIHIENIRILDSLELNRWPIFNFADIYICAGVMIILIFAFFENKSKSPKARS